MSVESGLQSLSVQVSSKSLFLLIISWFCGNEVIYVYRKLTNKNLLMYRPQIKYKNLSISF